MKRQTWTPDDDARVADMRRQGMSDADIGAQIGRSKQAVLKRRVRRRLAEPAVVTTLSATEPLPEPEPIPAADARIGDLGRGEWTEDDDRRAVAMRAQGLGDADIAASLGRTAAAVMTRLSKLRLRGAMDVRSRRRRSPWTPERMAEARRLRAEGMTLAQVAARVGSDIGSVSRALRSAVTTEDMPGEGVRVGRTVPDIDRSAREVEQARAALARAEARHRQAMDGVLAPLREAIRLVGLVPSSEGDGDPAALLVERLRGRGVEFRRVA